ILTNAIAREMQVSGIAARASGIDSDTRRDHPFAAYGQMTFRVPIFHEGDVWARLMVRVEEVRESVQLIYQVFEALATIAPTATATAITNLHVGDSAFGLVEGWRGPVWHWVTVGEDGSLARVKVKDPSFSNWPALNYAILNNIVPDFPLCNKSFNLS